jgi:hypothetical protein
VFFGPSIVVRLGDETLAGSNTIIIEAEEAQV